MLQNVLLHFSFVFTLSVQISFQLFGPLSTGTINLFSCKLLYGLHHIKLLINDYILCLSYIASNVYILL